MQVVWHFAWRILYRIRRVVGGRGDPRVPDEYHVNRPLGRHAGERPACLLFYAKEEWHEAPNGAFSAGIVSEKGTFLPAQLYQPDVRRLYVFLRAGHVFAGKCAACLCGVPFRQGNLHRAYLGFVLWFFLRVHRVFLRAGRQCKKPEMDQRHCVLFTARRLFHHFSFFPLIQL